MTTTRPLRVLLADDEALFRHTIRDLINATPGMTMIAEATNGCEAVTLAAAHRPDVVLMDVRMPDLDGIAATERITADVPAPQVLVLTTFDLDDHVYELRHDLETVLDGWVTLTVFDGPARDGLTWPIAWCGVEV